MIIYHGSEKIIKKPEYGFGNKKNDYGLGFYCTENIELAKEWACSNSEISGYANQYEIKFDEFKVLDLRSDKYSILNWIAILLKHRTFDVNNPISIITKEYLINNFYINVEEYDIIIGYRADDSYFSFAKDFINNTISVQQLGLAIKLGKLGDQIVLKSKKVFEKIKFLNYEIAEGEKYYAKRISKDIEARSIYLNLLRNDLTTNGIFVMDIVRKGLKNGDKII